MIQYYQNLGQDFQEYAANNKEIYTHNKPFPHIVIDNYFSEEVLDSLLEEFPDPESNVWHSSNQESVQIKLRSNWENNAQVPKHTYEMINFLNSGDVLRSLSELTGIEGLIADPYLTGGGLNCILPGGQLAVHADGNWHDLMKVHRRVNLILFLNKNWQTEWNGQLEFWDEKLENCEKKIDPIFNRIVVFTTHDYTFHGHPAPLMCPPGESRKSLIMYYYTSYPRPQEQTSSSGVHRAEWKITHDGGVYKPIG